MAGRVAVLVHGAHHGEFADARLAFQRQPLAGVVHRLHLVAGAQPQRARADQPGQEHARRGDRLGARPHAALGELDVHDAAGEPALAAHRAAVHPGRDAAGQLDHDGRGRVAAGKGLGGLRQQHRLLGRVEHLPGVVVHHHHVVVQGEHDPGGAPAGAQVLLEQLELADAAVGQQGLLDLPGRGLRERQQQRVGVLAPAGEVDRADGLAGDRVVDRHTRAGEVLQVLGVVLVAEDVHRPAALQRRADAVGADELLGVAEPGRQLDPVEVRVEIVVGGHPGQHQPGLVGEDDADRLPVQVFAQMAQHRQRAAGQRGVEVGIAQVGQVDPVGGHVPSPGPPPRGQDRVTYLVRVDVLGGQELLAGLRQVVRCR